MGESRWLDADAAAGYVCLKEDAFLRRVRDGVLPGPRIEPGKRKPRWSTVDIDDRMRGVTAPTPPKIKVKPEVINLKPINEILDGAVPRWELISGIYFLIKDGAVAYVGQSKDIFGRVSSHVRDGVKDFDSWSHIPCPVEELDVTELAYILALKPPLNVRGNINVMVREFTDV